MPIRFHVDADLNQVIVSAVVRRAAPINFNAGTEPRRSNARMSSVPSERLHRLHARRTPRRNPA